MAPTLEKLVEVNDAITVQVQPWANRCLMNGQALDRPRSDQNKYIWGTVEKSVPNCSFSRLHVRLSSSLVMSPELSCTKSIIQVK